MTKGHLIIGLDIGTSSIKLLMALKNSEEGDLTIVDRIEVENFGMRKGVVIDSGEVAKKIKEAISSLGQKILGVVVGINGNHLRFVPSRGLVSVSRADQKISEADIDRAIQASLNLSLSQNEEVLDTISQEFVVDGLSGVKEALGLRGIRLEAKTLCEVVFSPYLNNLEEAALKAGLEINFVMPCILASSQAVLSPEEKEVGVAVIDLGAGTTNLAVFEEGVLLHAAVFPFGASNITNDIAVVLKTEIETAERIKKELVEPLRKPKSDFSPKIVSRVAEARAREILAQVGKELKKIDKTKLPSGVVLVGGGAKLAKISDLVKKELKLACRIGLPLGIEDPAWATAVGLALENAKSVENFSFAKGILEKIKAIIP